MGARTLEARLTARLVGLAGAVLVAVGVAAVAVTDRVLDATDTAIARAHARSARDELARELGEGDGTEEAVQEVLASGEAEGVRLAVHLAGRAPQGATLLALPAGACATQPDAQGKPWRVCAEGDPASRIVAAISIDAHRAAVVSLSRGMIAVVAVALLALWLAVRSALRAPVAELTALVGWTGRIVEAEIALEPPSSRTREIAQLESAFDALVRRLLDALARERANSAHIAHELRTPLTLIVAELEAVRVEDQEARDALARVQRDVARLSDVIDAILVLSDRARPGHEQAIVNVADVVRDLAPPGSRVEAPDEALVEGDQRLVSLALRNLIENARKYGAGVRLVRIAREGTRLRLAVVDDGPGLDEQARARMFDRYWRGAADSDGRGLGLALVRAVAERHGGRAEARPGTHGRGLEVSMTLEPVVGWHEQAPA